MSQRHKGVSNSSCVTSTCGNFFSKGVSPKSWWAFGISATLSAETSQIHPRLQLRVLKLHLQSLAINLKSQQVLARWGKAIIQVSRRRRDSAWRYRTACHPAGPPTAVPAPVRSFGGLRATSGGDQDSATPCHIDEHGMPQGTERPRLAAWFAPADRSTSAEPARA